ncbi:kinase-like protein [Rhizophagus irregularis]|uniref:Kinase-like protein n=1 Tax=Rhizophagus irregularis TaxID=588596 RepID=A0A2N0Q3P6_9GLOM|nr:kinase-like protein [Rhizophagus irregularis]
MDRGDNLVRGNVNDDCFVLKSFSSNDDKTINKVVYELEMLHAVDHENILRFYGITRIEGDMQKRIPQINKHILVLEYADSGTLNTYLSKHFNELKWNDKLSLAFQLASAVSYLHDSGIIHCDLHANNILVHQKCIKLAGFGLPSEASNETSNPLHLFDVIPYMDPKRLEIANYDLDKRSDVYSVGALLWQISSGRKPFHAENYDISLSSAICQGKREDDIDGTPIVYSNLYKDKRPDMKEVVSIIRSVLVETQSTINIQEEIKDVTTEWVEDILKNAKVQFISFKDLKDPVSLGEGGFGRTIKAIWSRTGNYVVYKRLINTTAIKYKYNTCEAFIHELKINLHLMPNYSDRIIRCLGISKDDKDYLLITQYADGGDLRNYLKNNFKKLTWDDKKKLAFQIADGLNYLHKENILHRDLHSKNIVIHENNAKIIDFGISKIQDQKSEASIYDRGIIAYVEPKRLSNINFLHTTASDIYSFGVLMWEISSGHPPFKNSGYNRSDEDALIYAINNGLREKPIPGTPKEYEELYKKCWDQEPNQRPIMSKILEEFAKMGFGVNSGKTIELTEAYSSYWLDLSNISVI